MIQIPALPPISYPVRRRNPMQQIFQALMGLPEAQRQLQREQLQDQLGQMKMQAMQADLANAPLEREASMWKILGQIPGPYRKGFASKMKALGIDVPEVPATLGEMYPDLFKTPELAPYARYPVDLFPEQQLGQFLGKLQSKQKPLTPEQSRLKMRAIDLHAKIAAGEPFTPEEQQEYLTISEQMHALDPEGTEWEDAIRIGNQLGAGTSRRSEQQQSRAFRAEESEKARQARATEKQRHDELMGTMRGRGRSADEALNDLNKAIKEATLGKIKAQTEKIRKGGTTKSGLTIMVPGAPGSRAVLSSAGEQALQHARQARATGQSVPEILRRLRGMSLPGADKKIIIQEMMK